MSSTRKKRDGFEYCLHKCNGGCYSRKNLYLWKKEGGALSRHLNNPKCHPRCSETCPAFQSNSSNGKQDFQEGVSQPEGYEPWMMEGHASSGEHRYQPYPQSNVSTIPTESYSSATIPYPSSSSLMDLSPDTDVFYNPLQPSQCHPRCSEACPAFQSNSSNGKQDFQEGVSQPEGYEPCMMEGHASSGEHRYQPYPQSNVSTIPTESYSSATIPYPSSSSLMDLSPDTDVFYNPLQPSQLSLSGESTSQTYAPSVTQPSSSSSAPSPLPSFSHTWSSPSCGLTSTSNPCISGDAMKTGFNERPLLKVILIPDPTRGIRGDVDNDPSFISTNAFKGGFPKLPDYAIRVKPRGKDKVQEWAWMCSPSVSSAVRIDIEVMSYSEFKGYVLDGDQIQASFENWVQVLKERDCMIGVPDYSIDYLNPDYGLTSENIEHYKRKMFEVRCSVLIWPPMYQVELSGQKDHLIRHLDRISQDMRTLRPKTETLKRGDPIPSDTVLKRTHSDSGAHVIFPNSTKREWVYMEQGPIGSVWLSQEYVPALRDIGEWRVVILNSEMQYVIHTIPNPEKKVLMSKLVQGFFSLDEWSAMQQSGQKRPTQAEIVNPTAYSQRIRRDAKDEFQKFVLDILRHLMRYESRQMASPSSLRVFCRIDISLIFDQNNVANYFVNEIERTNTASLWTSLQRNINSTIINDFQAGLFEWVKETRSTSNLTGLG